MEKIPVNIYEWRESQHKIEKILFEMYFERMKKDILKSSKRMLKYINIT